MAQADYNIAPSPSGLNLRTEVNTIFSAILSNNSGSTAPTVTSAFMLWVDTSNATYYYLKMRNHDDTSWVTLGIYTVSTKTYISYIDGDQTVGGIKQFTSFPVTPSSPPTTNYQVANKKYVDDNASVVAASETVAGKIELATTAEAQAGTDDLRAITPLKLRNALNASGTAPIYACRAWVNFNGTGTVAIRASGNVSSITDDGVGEYTVNFTTAMPDINYNTVGDAVLEGNVGAFVNPLSMGTYVTSSARIRVSNQGAVVVDLPSVSVAIFR